MRSTSVLAVSAALALSGCGVLRQDALDESWTETKLSPREMRAAKLAVADVAETHVFDWNMVAAQRNGKALHVWLDALPEPHADGSIAEPVVHCLGAVTELECAVTIERALYTQVDVRGRSQRVAAVIADDIETAEAVALVEQALEVAASVTREDQCPVPRRADAWRFAELRDSFMSNGTELPLNIGRDGTQLHVRRHLPAGAGDFIFHFERSDGSHKHLFLCWDREETVVTP